MKKKETKLLLEMLDKERNIDFNPNVFSDPAEAQLIFNDLKILKESSAYDQDNFGPFFKMKVMSRVYNLVKTGSKQKLDEVLSRFFNKVMVAGTLAIIIAIIMLYAQHGQVGLDIITGIEQDNDINFISSLFNEY